MKITINRPDTPALGVRVVALEFAPETKFVAEGDEFTVYFSLSEFENFCEACARVRQGVADFERLRITD